MEVRFDEAQDLTLLLTEEEERILLSGPTKYFGEMHTTALPDKDRAGGYSTSLIGICKELEASVMLGYTTENFESFAKVEQLSDNRGWILIPDPGSGGPPWRINLSAKGIGHYKRGWLFGVRYDGEHKLFIRRKLSKLKNEK